MLSEAVHYQAIATPGRKLHLHVWESPGWAPPDATVIFLHGMGAYCGANAVELAQRVCTERRLRVIAPDMPGYGRTAAIVGGDFDPRRLARLIREEILHSLEAGPVHLAGHSWGGDIAAFLAADDANRVTTLALLDGGVTDWEPAPSDAILAAARAFDERCRYDSMELFFRGLQAQFRRWTPAMRWAFGHTAASVDGSIRLIQRPETYAQIRLAGIARQVSRVRGSTGRTLLLQGADPVHDVRIDLPTSWNHELIPACGHFLLEDAPDDVSSRLLAWWSHGEAGAVMGRARDTVAHES